MSERTLQSAADYACEYVRRGWSVFPILPRAKQPAVTLAPFLSGEQRMDEFQARAFWTEHPDFGIGIVCGKPSGLVVIDVDPRNGGDFEAVAKTIEDELRLCAATGGGGMHFFCAYPDGHDRIPKGKTILPGVDRQSDGGYVVAAPSVHPSGERYRWEECGFAWTEAEPSTMPAWVIQKPDIQPGPDAAPSQPWVADTLANPEACKPGSQEDTLARLCWWAARNLEQDIAQAVLGAWMRQLPLGNPHDPWTDEHLAEKLDRAFEKRPADPGNAGPIVDDTPIGSVEWETPATMAFPDQEWIVEDFAAPGAFTEIIGKVKKGKSTLTYQLLAAVLKGEPFIGRATIKTPAVLLTEQTGTSLKKTLERAGLLGTADLHILLKQRVKTLGWAKAIRAATAKCIEVGARILIVDTLSRLASIGGDSENSSGAVTILDPFGEAREAGVACIFVRHARKGQSGETDEIADAARGSSAITGDMDIVLRLASYQDDYRCLSWESRITDDPEDVYLEYHEGTYEVIERPAGRREQQTTEDMQLFRDAVERVGRSYAPLQQELGWGRSKIATYLKKLKTFDHGPHALPLED
jgi:hypothetical protein